MVELDIQHEGPVETEQQRLEREARELAVLRDRRARRSLREAPGLVMYVRSVSIGGQSERGETLVEWSAPMRIAAADASDAVYAQLVDWVTYWAGVLEVAPPSSAVVASRNFQWAHKSAGFKDAAVLGFKSGTTPEGAYLLVKLLTMWLLTHADRIVAVEDAGAVEAYQDDVSRLVRELRGQFPTAPRPQRDVVSRECPKCCVEAVGAEWGSEDVRDVRVFCGSCGFVVPVKTYARVLEWVVS
jgi:hypothetical protein